MVVGIVVAAGRGTRMGFQKQYATLLGKPVWQWSVEALWRGGAEDVWLVVPSDDVKRVSSKVPSGPNGQKIHVVAGGASRHESVVQAVKGIANLFRNQKGTGLDNSKVLVAIHDAARPFVAEQDVQRVCEEARQHGAAILAIPCGDTVKRVQEGSIEATLPRVKLWLAQTPQVIRLDWLKEVYLQTVHDTSAYTDDASAMEQAGYKVRVVGSLRENRKLTTPEDWSFAEWLAEKTWGGETK